MGSVPSPPKRGSPTFIFEPFSKLGPDHYFGCKRARTTSGVHWHLVMAQVFGHHNSRQMSCPDVWNDCGLAKKRCGH